MATQTPETAIQLRQLNPGTAHAGSNGFGGTPTGNYAEVYVGTQRRQGCKWSELPDDVKRAVRQDLEVSA